MLEGFARRQLTWDPDLAARYGAAARVRAATEFPAARMVEAVSAALGLG